MLSSELIHKVINNDERALSEVLIYYSKRLKKECYFYKYDRCGIPHLCFDEEKEAKLIEKIAYALKKFKE